ncbi:RTA1-like protein [Mycena alexandri]|uniref:RTA1-like protein n=1 Tax=Mycena alexandri TaxID=1745969 RepID=A0AAD6SP52_9AGAR|nr:RTA1-like protein [Mycena alexandri]
MPALDITHARPSTSLADSQYGYVPHEYVAVLFIALFGLSTILHIGQAAHYRMWWLFPTVCLCGIGEIIGWSGRLWSSFSPSLHTPFMIQVISTVISPTPLIAVNFVLLAWIITKLGPAYARLAPTTYTIIFVCSDILALLVQAAGGSIAAGAHDLHGAQVGAHIMLGGIVFQFTALITYCYLAADFLIRFANDRPVYLPRTSGRPLLDMRTKRMIFALSFSTLVLFIRSIYRIVELGSGWHGRIMHTEVYFNVLDGAMVLLAMLTFNFDHPGALLGPHKPEAPAEYGAKLEDVSTQMGTETVDF